MKLFLYNISFLLIMIAMVYSQGDLIPPDTSLSDALQMLRVPYNGQAGQTKYGFTAQAVNPWWEHNPIYSTNVKSGVITIIYDSNNNGQIDKEDSRGEEKWNAYIIPVVSGTVEDASQADTPLNLYPKPSYSLMQFASKNNIPFTSPINIGDGGYAVEWNGKVAENKRGRNEGAEYKAVFRHGLLLLSVEVKLIGSNRVGYWSKETGRYTLYQSPPGQNKFWYQGGDEVVNTMNSMYDKLPKILEDTARKAIAYWDTWANIKKGPGIGLQGLFPRTDLIDLTISPNLLPKGLLPYPLTQPGIGKMQGRYYVFNPGDNWDRSQNYDINVTVTPHNGNGNKEKLFAEQIWSINYDTSLDNWKNWKDVKIEKISIPGADEGVRVTSKYNDNRELATIYDNITLRCANAVIKVRGTKDNMKQSEKLPYTVPLAKTIIAKLLNKTSYEVDVVNNIADDVKKYRWAKLNLSVIELTETPGYKIESPKIITNFQIGPGSPEQIIGKPEYLNGVLNFNYSRKINDDYLERGTGSCYFSDDCKTIVKAVFDEYRVRLKDGVEQISNRWQVSVDCSKSPIPIGSEIVKGRSETTTVILQEYLAQQKSDDGLVMPAKTTGYARGTAKTADIEMSMRGIE